MAKPDPERGLTLVYTGDGKGKTTAALGLAVRASGHGKKVLIIQFIKSANSRSYGEQEPLDTLGIELIQTGVGGFTWEKTPEEHRSGFEKAWTLTKERVMSGDYDVVILDELNNVLALKEFPVDDVVPLEEVLELIDNRPEKMHLVLTGRNAHERVMEKADLVSEVVMKKHYYNEGVSAVLGLEF